MSRDGQGIRAAVARGSDLPVLLPAAGRLARSAAEERAFGLPALRLTPGHGVVILLLFLLATGAAEAETAPLHASVIMTLLKWTPLLLKGFAFNIAISFFAMAIGTAAGTGLGLAQISLLPPVRRTASFAMHFFRNAPWLVVLFYCMFLLPFQVRIFGVEVPLPDWIKATFGLGLPVMANVAEIVRGAVQSIPSGQWESANSLAFSRRQTIWMIILPQCVKRMLPPWMNLYAILAMSTVLASVVGVSEVMTLTGDVLAAENRSELLLPFYSYILVWFFLYCYPIARWTVSLERRFSVNI
ncbi:MAG TPA: amino acid ABC transporter permease [Alphaproteobacteria bacterium]|nr:amino acid ABC transporter permease [Alphaproteobacteria bacterium]